MNRTDEAWTKQDEDGNCQVITTAIDQARKHNGRRSFLSQAAATVFVIASSVFCSCRARSSSSSSGDAGSGTSQELAVQKERPADKSASTADVEQRVIEIVAEQMGIPPGKVRRESRFAEDLGADSLDTVELFMEFEEEFRIRISDDEAVKALTVGQAIDLATKLNGGRPLPPRKTRRSPKPSGNEPRVDRNRPTLQSDDQELLAALQKVTVGRMAVEDVERRFGRPIHDTQRKEPMIPIRAISFGKSAFGGTTPGFSNDLRVVYWASPLQLGDNVEIIGLIWRQDGVVETFRAVVLLPE
jgi:acyl carrier protein